MNMRSVIPWRNKTPSFPATRGFGEDVFSQFRQEFDRMFDDFFRTTGLPSQFSANDGGFGISPVIDYSETDKDVVINAELPGVSEKDLDVSIVGDLLTIKGEKKHEKDEEEGESRYVERRYGAFSRTVRLPFDAGDQDVEARMNNGILTVRVPKPAELQREARRIEVKAA